MIVGISKRGKARVVGCLTGAAYSDDRGMVLDNRDFVEKVLKESGSRWVYGDSLYGTSVELIEFVMGYGKIVCPVEDGIHNKVKYPLRRECERGVGITGINTIGIGIKLSR
ncbi:MAG: hypothetical protein RMJ37_01995 [Spirochaetia bacterium]|nr:hypothetical protein [Spirochaetota bacterium]MCX8097135.1 hypothetical protein [Spirochaetota bacterium]MDW8112096.1 hypothetical protein [Spirochaetia bacterium]